MAGFTGNLFRSAMLAGVLALACACTAGKTESPNIVLILADDLGWSDTGAYGGTFIDTPNIDRLAAEGMRLTRFYANPVCSPSRVAIHSGQHAARLGVTDFISGLRFREQREDDFIRGHWRPFEVVDTPRTRRAIPDVRTIGDVLQDAGYRTAYFGKWHVGSEPDRQPEFLGYGTSVLVNAFADETPGLQRIAAAVTGFLARDDERPFFLFLSPTEPHIPLHARPDLLQKYERRAAQREAAVPIPKYAAVVEELDEFVGAVRASLHDMGMLEDTVFIFMSDNGGLENYDLGIGGRVTSSLPLRGEKGTLYEGGLRVPFVVRWPGRVAPNSSNGMPFAVYDLLPTLAAIVGVSVEDDIDGDSFLGVLTGAQAGSANPVFFHYPHYHHDRPGSVIIDGDWKLIEFLDGGGPELYNLADDPGETRDLAPAEPGVLARLQRKLDEWQASVGAQIPIPNPRYDAERAHEWWTPATNQPVDTDTLRRLLKGTDEPDERN